jgi:hypothetical protein
LKRHFTLSLILLGILSIATIVILTNSVSENKNTESFYVGVTFCGNTSAEAKLLIDRVKSYTNLFVLQSGPISKNETATNEICDYAVAAGLHIIVYFGYFDYFEDDSSSQIPWLDFAQQEWGDRFLGVYYYDEPGGTQLDYNWARCFSNLKLQNSPMYRAHAAAMEAFLNGSLAKDYDLAAKLYVDILKNDSGIQELKKRSITTFTSDYALYWFDYLGGYDVMLAQFGWNDTLSRSIGLIRGAARLQNKDWGAIITWKYTEEPYLDNETAIYNQMLMAYQAGARYVVIFNYPQYPEGNDYGVLSDKHFEALERFWNDVVMAPQATPGSIEAEAALVLPPNYGWGMRRPNDQIWYWQSGERAQIIWELSLELLSEYDTRLDIVCDDPAFPATGKYEKIFYWSDYT